MISAAQVQLGAGLHYTTSGTDEILEANTNVFKGTMAEWEQLTTLQKKEYTAASIEEDSLDGTLDVYSTSEVKTNKVWIDNKPIYRKVLSYTTARVSGTNANIGSISNADTVVDLKIFLKASNGVTAFAERYSEASDYMTMWFASGDIMFRQANSSSIYLEAPLTAIIEYTKTTD